jgi:hypothetical protein
LASLQNAKERHVSHRRSEHGRVFANIGLDTIGCANRGNRIFLHIAADMKILKEFAQAAIAFHSICDHLANISASVTTQSYTFADL